MYFFLLQMGLQSKEPKTIDILQVARAISARPEQPLSD
jgi:hypothetical protein